MVIATCKHSQLTLLYFSIHRHVTDVDLESLPTVIKGEYKLLCDICMRDGIHDQFSTVYCIECATKFCHKHELVSKITSLMSFHFCSAWNNQTVYMCFA